jgi:hypothetical protein
MRRNKALGIRSDAQIRVRQLAGILSMLPLAACASNESYIGASSYDSTYDPGEHLSYGVAIQTFIRGSPFPTLPPALGMGAVLADMQNGGFPQTAFTTAIVPRSPYRVLMVFAPTSGTGLEQLCEIDPASISALPLASVPPSEGRIGLAAVFCRADRLMAGSGGSIPTGVAPNDARVKGAIQGFMRKLFPASNPASGGFGSDQPQ